MTKLTLSVDEEIVEQAKRLAAQNRTSVSAMFSEFVRAMAQDRQTRRPGGRIARRASGLIRLPRRKSVRGTLAEALAEKYGL